MRVFVTGGSGFVGSSVIAKLLEAGHSVNALVHSRALRGYDDRVRSFPGGLFDAKAVEAAMFGCDAVIHIVGIIMEKPSQGATFDRIHFQGTKNIVDAARHAKIKRYIQMSALGTRADAVSNYHKSKFRAEEYVRGSGLDWTIFRPSLIHGPKGEFMQMEAMWARKRAPAPVLFMPFMPYFGAGLVGGGGAGKLQPVFVEDVARAFVEALENRRTIGEVIPVAGTQQVTWPQMHQIVSQQIVGKKRLSIPIPVWAAKLYCAIGVAKFLGFNRDQVLMSQEDNTTDLQKFVDFMGWTTADFESSLATYARSM